MYIRRSVARVNASHANTISSQEAIYLPRRYWVWPDCMIALLVRGQLTTEHCHVRASGKGSRTWAKNSSLQGPAKIRTYKV